MSRSPDDGPDVPLTWVAVLALKWLGHAKSRLGVGSLRPAVALAMARDTVDAALAGQAVGSAILVSSDPAVHLAFAGVAGVRLVRDPGGGLDVAVAAGVRAARQTDPTVGIVVLQADLPALLPGDLDQAISLAAANRRCFVADRAATGTSALFLHPGAALWCRFGAGSRRAHRRLGLCEIRNAELASLRLDVDTIDDLRDAAALGLGPHTARLLARVAHSEQERSHPVTIPPLVPPAVPLPAARPAPPPAAPRGVVATGPRGATLVAVAGARHG